jgi:pSer/pThr/pTyr-binding forkhead associated (FHA) protein
VGAQTVIGRFDSETGPVDVDLGQLPEAIYISRRHAEIKRDDSGAWVIKDLGAGNGTFIRPKGQNKFQRITGDQAIHDGDEFALGNAQFEFHIT